MEQKAGNLNEEAQRMVNLAGQINELLKDNDCIFAFDQIDESFELYNQRDGRCYRFPTGVEKS